MSFMKKPTSKWSWFLLVSIVTIDCDLEEYGSTTEKTKLA